MSEGVCVVGVVVASALMLSVEWCLGFSDSTREGAAVQDPAADRVSDVLMVKGGFRVQV